MKIVSWLGALVLFLGVAIGTASVLRPHSSLPAASVVAAAPQTGATAGGPSLVARSPITIPTPRPKPAPAKVAAPVKAAAPVARPAARTSIVVRSTQQALINQDRARYGLRPLTWSSCLASIAYSNAARMSAQDYISHTNGASLDLGCHLGYQGGENVGWWSGGVNDAQINSMFMNSPEHKANILGPYHYVATAWVTDSDGYAYIAVEFG